MQGIARLLAWVPALACTPAVASPAKTPTDAPGPSVIWQLQLLEGPKDITLGPDGTLYVAVGGTDGTLVAITSDGRIAWSWTAHRAGSASRPIVEASGDVYTLFRDRLVRVTSTGRLVWSRKVYADASLGNAPRTSLALGPDGTIYVAAAYLYAFAPDGRPRWQLKLGGPVDAIRVGATGDVEALHGRKLATVSPIGVLLREKDDAEAAQFAIERGGTVYRLGWAPMEPERRPSSFNTLRAERGDQILWSFAPGREISGVAPADDVVYVGGLVVAAIERETGRVRWRVNTTGGGVVPVPRGVVAGCSGEGLVCGYEANGRLTWTWGRGRLAPKTLARGPNATIYVAGSDRMLTALALPR